MNSSETMQRSWATALGTSDSQAFVRRLAWDATTQDELLAQWEAPFSARSNNVSFRHLSAWLESSNVIDPSHLEPPTTTRSFEEIWRRIALSSLSQLAAVLPRAIATVYEADAADWGKCTGIRRDLADDLIRQLSIAGEAAMWEAFNERRTTAQLIRAHLSVDPVTGQAPRYLYCSFLEGVRASGLRVITIKCPVLETILPLIVERWLQNSVNLLTRVHDDLGMLRSTFGLPGDASLSSVQLNCSDPHRGGQEVAILCFRSLLRPADDLRVVYKPKDLTLDLSFQDLLGKLHIDGGVAVLARTLYGYMQYVPHRLCGDEAELRRFYQKAGRLAAVLYILGCVDCHSENLIACGDNLVLVDGETLFEGVAFEHRSFDNQPSRSSLQPRIDASILRLGLLPQWMFIGELSIPHDVSALGTQTSANPVTQREGWCFINTDAMSAGQVAESHELQVSSPVGFGSRNRFTDFGDTFCRAFEDEMLHVMDTKSRWLGEGGFLSTFQHCTRRFISRPTWIYHWLHKQQFETKHLRSALAQRLLLENLARTLLLSRTKPDTWPMLAAEVEQMEALDIPFFELSVSSRDLELSTGAVVRNFMEVSGYEHACNRIETLNREVIDFEVRLIRGVVASRRRSRIHGFGKQEDTASSDDSPVTPQTYLIEAERIADSLVESAIELPDLSMEWMCVRSEEDQERSGYGPIGPTLYSGQPGVALFLAAMAQRRTPNADTYSRVAASAIANVIKFTTSASEDALARWWRDQPLGLAGSGGILLALLKLCELLPGLRSSENIGIPRLLDALDPGLLRGDTLIDVMFGCAGLVGPLLAEGSAQGRMLAEVAGDALVQRQGTDGGWTIPSIGPLPLTGFSHGASGMIAALARLHATTHHDRFAEAAEKGLRYERTAFMSDAGNWIDFREPFDPASPRSGLSWCHGAPGIAVSRICLAGTALSDADCETELARALQSTAVGTETGDSVCCGRMGRAAVLRLASKALHLQTAASQLESQCLAHARRDGEYSFVDNVGLFMGSAGLALGLLDGTAQPGQKLLPTVLSAGLL